MHWLSYLADRIDRCNEAIGTSVAWLTLVMVIITFVVVVLRYGFNLGSIAMQETIHYMHAFVFMLAAAYTLKKDEHVRVDIFYQKLSIKGKAWVDLLGSLFLLMPVMIFILWFSAAYVFRSWQIVETSPEAGGLTFVYCLKTTLLLMPVLMLLQGISTALKSLLTIYKPNSEY